MESQEDKSPSDTSLVVENREVEETADLQSSGDSDKSRPPSSAIEDRPEAQSAEEKVLILEKAITELNADFGAKRAQFKELYVQKENELTKEKEARSQLESDVKKLQEELNETKSQVTIAELSKENEVEIERQKRKHEMTSIRMKFEEAMQNAHSKYEAEIHHLKVVNQKLEGDLNEVKVHLLAPSGSDVGPGAVFSAVTKSLARKLNSTMSASNDSLHTDIEDVVKKTGKYAQEDAEMLRSLVIQLEEEVSALKEKLRNSDDQLATVQGAQASIVKGNDALTVLMQGQDVQGVLTQFDDKLREARCGLEAEKSSRADLEMYVAFANAQKTLLQDELDKVKLQIRELRQNYELEKKKNEELKETWEKANDHFVSNQNEYLETLSQYERLLTREQLQILSKTDKGQLSQSSESAAPEPHINVDSQKEEVVGAVCQDCEKNLGHVEKLRSDLHKAAKLRNEMEEEWGRISHEFQTKLGVLEEEVVTYEVVLLELNTSCQQSMEQMEGQIKRLGFERESIQRKIEKLEAENDNLKGKHVAHSHQLQNEYISLPNDVMELQEMLLRLKEELISVKVGKEQIEGELKFVKDQIQMIEEEKASIEESLNQEIVSLKETMMDIKSRNEKQEEERNRQEKYLTEVKSKLSTTEAQIGKMYHLKKQNQDLVKEKEMLHGEVQELNGKVTTLRKELTNSEELQKDLIALSKSLQVNLESIRQAETEVRWQHPDDVGQCNTCRKSLYDSKEKHHCKHCGRVFCADCTERTVRLANRDYNVCGVCHTLLVHDSAPYFSTEPPHSPD